MQLGHIYKIVIVGFFISLLTFLFWTESRYPELNEKQQMGSRVDVSRVLSFNPLIQVKESDTFFKKFWAGSVNWYDANKKGMTFGLLLASLVFLLIPLLQNHLRFKSPFIQSLVGATIGAPLGVCTNCAAPIAHSYYLKTGQLSSALSILHSSPMLNLVVFTMVTSLFSPMFAIAFYLAIGFHLLIVVPIIAKFFSNNQPSFTESSEPISQEQGSIFQAIIWFLKEWLKSLWTVLKLTLPLMILSGPVGTLGAELFPFHEYFSVASIPLWQYFVMATIGVFLPVPMGFNVMLSFVLVESGLPIELGWVLCFSLGIYSIYPFSIIFTQISKRVAVFLFLAIIAIASIGGITFGKFYRHQLNETTKEYAMRLIEGDFPDQEILQAIRETCTQVQDSIEQTDCLNNVLIEEVVYQLGGLPLCERIDPKRKELCRQRIIYRIGAIEGAGTGLCLLLQEGGQRSACQADVITYQAKSDFNEFLCQSIEQKVLRESCEKTVFLEKSKKFLSYKPCKNLGSIKERENCRLLVSNMRIAQESDLEHCKHFELENNKTICVNRTKEALDKIEKVNEPEASQKTEKELYQECRSVQGRDCRFYALDYVRYLIQPQLAKLKLNFLSSKKAATFLDKKTFSSFSREKPSSSSSHQLVSRDHHRFDIYQKVLSSPGPKQIGRFNEIPIDTKNIDFFSPINFVEPFSYGRGIATLDYNHDGLTDVLLGNRRGFLLYQNNGTQNFIKKTFSFDNVDDIYAIAAANLDRNNEIDLFFADANGHLYFRKNAFQKGAENKRLENCSGNIQALTLYDIDQDSDLDLIVGGWMLGPENHQNCIYRNQDNQFIKEFLKEPQSGPTLAIFASRPKYDEDPILISSNDFSTPDYFYSLKGDQLEPKNKIINLTSEHSMSYDSADIDHDGIFEFFSTDNAFSGVEFDEQCSTFLQRHDRAECVLNERIDNITRSGSIRRCLKLPSEQDQFECQMTIFTHLARMGGDHNLCALIPGSLPQQKELCENLTKGKQLSSQSLYANRRKIYRDLGPRQRARNALLKYQDGHWNNIASQYNLSKTSWSWNATFQDVDNNGYDDLYIGNGIQGFAIGRKGVYPNYYFENKEGVLSSNGDQIGLDIISQTPNFVFSDFDLDGDLDLFLNTVNGPPRFYQNNLKVSSSLSLFFESYSANNPNCIGCVIKYQWQGKTLFKEIKQNGGFLLSREPKIHFGLGNANSLKLIELKDTSNNIVSLGLELKSGHRYLLKGK